MKSKSKLLLGIFLITGIIVLCYIGATNIVNSEPIEQDGDDPGNSRGPGFWDSLPVDEIQFSYNVDMALNTLI